MNSFDAAQAGFCGRLAGQQGSTININMGLTSQPELQKKEQHGNIDEIIFTINSYSVLTIFIFLKIVNVNEFKLLNMFHGQFYNTFVFHLFNLNSLLCPWLGLQGLAGLQCYRGQGWQTDRAKRNITQKT